MNYYAFRGYTEHRIIIAAPDQHAARQKLAQLGRNWTQAGQEVERQDAERLGLVEIHRPGMPSHHAMTPGITT